ncbi:hypothetical protein [Nitrosospira briensis]|uniref:hypothetical protein n=1 Tax=Nitrosospira briensis TaxID=35799 RepID=UPI0008F1702A|nr:hypothetical protein [Nitrosospira briensis]SFO23193.1 hypothetical protein SAMN05216332_10867 [Nitrosospira briensis]
MKNRFSPTTLILPISLILFLPVGASAGDSCRNILADGFYKEYAKSNVQRRDRSMYADLCSLDFQQASNAIKRVQQTGADQAPGLTYGLYNLDEVDVDAGGNPKVGSPVPDVSEEKFGQWKSGYCSKSSPADSSQAAEFLMQKTVGGSTSSPAPAVDSWAACKKKQQGLTCWAAPAPASSGGQNEEFLLNVNWTKTGSSQSRTPPEIKYSFLTRGAVSKFEGAPAKRILPADYKLSAGTLQIPVVRPADTGVFASLKVNHGGTEHSCKVFVPGERDFTLSEPFLNRLKFRYPG